MDRRRFVQMSTASLLGASLSAPLVASAAVRPAPAYHDSAAPPASGEILYENPLASPEDVHGWRLEGDAAITFPRGRMRMENLRSPEEGQEANFVYWCPEDFPSSIDVSWDYWPIYEPGLSMLFFSAKGRQGEDLFDPALAERTGVYGQYNRGDINAYHVSYFRRIKAPAKRFHTCNLRKSYGFHLAARGGDPIPHVDQAVGPYRIRMTKRDGAIAFFVNDLQVLHWTDDGETYGEVLGGGKVGFRQMAPLIAEYANLTVRTMEVDD